MRQGTKIALLAATVMLLAASPVKQTTGETGLSVGAAKIEITPPPEELVAPFTSVADPLYLRVILVESGGKRVALIVADVPTIDHQVAASLVKLTATQAHMPEANVLLGTSHTHNVMRVAPPGAGIILPGSQAFVDRVTDALRRGLDEAKRRMRPARIGLGAGKTHLIGNRNQWSASEHRYVTGVDRTGREPIDSDLRVVKFEARDGKPIALMLNYAIEPVIAMAMEKEVSGDVPGAASRYIEQRLGGDAVALFTIGAAGTPLYRKEPGQSSGPDPRDMMRAMGMILGEEALATAAEIRTDDAGMDLSGAATRLECPGKLTKPYNLPNQCSNAPGSALPACTFKDADGPPSRLNLGVIRIGDLALVQTDANVTPAVGLKLRDITPVSATWIVALTYGPMRYIVDDAAYAQNSYEATATTAKIGCAEQAYLNGARKLLSKTQ